MEIGVPVLLLLSREPKGTLDVVFGSRSKKYFGEKVPWRKLSEFSFDVIRSILSQAIKKEAKQKKANSSSTPRTNVKRILLKKYTLFYLFFTSWRLTYFPNQSARHSPSSFSYPSCPFSFYSSSSSKSSSTRLKRRHPRHPRRAAPSGWSRHPR